MLPDTEKKYARIVPLVYLILAVTGSFAFSTGEAFRFNEINKDILGSKIYFSSIVHTVDWLAEDTPIISKAYKYSNSPLRSGLLRFSAFTGITGLAIYPVKSNFKINKNDIFPAIRNLVPLKLLI